METYWLQVEQLQSSLCCEQERCSTLELELASTGTRLQESSERCEALTFQLQQFREERQEEVGGCGSFTPRSEIRVIKLRFL